MKIDIKILTTFLRRYTYGERLHPLRDWFVILMCVFLLVLGSAAVNAWYFVRVVSGETIGAAVVAPESAAGVSLDHVKKLFERRAAEEAKYRDGYNFIDPSRPGS